MNLQKRKSPELYNIKYISLRQILKILFNNECFGVPNNHGCTSHQSYQRFHTNIRTLRKADCGPHQVRRLCHMSAITASVEH